MSPIRTILNPKTIALIGATERENSFARAVLENLLLSKDRTVFPVNPCRKSVLGLTCYPTIEDVPAHIDLAFIVSRAARVPGFVEACGKAGVGGIIIASSGFRETGPQGKCLEDMLIEIGKKHGVRIIGPNSMGIIRPNENLNAAIVRTNLKKGKIAFVSQSEAFGRTLLDWGISAHIGFSMFTSLGSMIDVDFADLIDFLGEDPHTKNIMIYIEESIGQVKKFISAARGVARNKPLIVLKPALPVPEPMNARTHTGMLADTEQVYDAVFRRTGAVRVDGAADLFNVAGILSAEHLSEGPRLLIVTNARGVGIMAANTLLRLGGELATLSDKTVEELDRVLPPYWKKENPLDILRDADVDRFTAAVNIGLGDPGVDGVLVIFTPQTAATPVELAQAVSDVAKNAWKPVYTAWMGGREVQKGREILRQNSIPTYDTPEEVVKTYLYLYRYKRNLGLLYETPEELPINHAPPNKNLKAYIRKAANAGASVLTEADSMRFLTNYGIPVLKARTVQSVDDAVQAAAEIGYPLVLKVSSPDIIFRIDVGGVATGITSEQELREEYAKLVTRVTGHVPDACIQGVTIQKMLEKIDYEIILGSRKDPIFGSVILFGMGGIAVQLFRDFSIGLPPLNQTLARRLMEETRIYKMLKGYRNKPPADVRQLEQIIVSFSNLIADFPEIAESDINPIAISNGVAYALDARIVLDKEFRESAVPYPHLVISPYPSRYIVPWTLSEEVSLLLRPIKPEDAPLLAEMYATISEEAFHGRFFQSSRKASQGMCERQCSIDYDREMGIVAEVKENGKKRIIGMGILITEPGQKSGEFAILVHDDYQGKGLGYKLIDMLIGIAQDKGLEEIFGIVLTKNRRMLSVCKMLGFTVERLPDSLSSVRLHLK